MLNFLRNHRHNVACVFGDGVIHLKPFADELRLPHMSQQNQKRLPEIFDVEHQNGFAVLAELRPSELFHQLFQCADPAGQSDEGIGAFIQKRDPQWQDR